jgi:hypothetical protein
VGLQGTWERDRKYQIVSATLLVFVNVGEDSIMVDNVITPLNPSITPVKEEEFEKTRLM